MNVLSRTTPSYATEKLEALCRELALRDYCTLPGDAATRLLSSMNTDGLRDWDAFQDSWNHLGEDSYMADGGRYRRRRHATLSAQPGDRHAAQEAHRPHYQSLHYNGLNGGVARHYEPIRNEILNGATMQSLLTLGCTVFGKLAPYTPWHIEAHQFRIEAGRQQMGKPTPEGVHRDGVNYVLMAMVKRRNLVNGATQIYDLERQPLQEFVLTEPLDLAFVNDERVFHGVTPIAPLDSEREATRDVLVLTFRRQ